MARSDPGVRPGLSRLCVVLGPCWQDKAIKKMPTMSSELPVFSDDLLADFCGVHLVCQILLILTWLLTLQRRCADKAGTCRATDSDDDSRPRTGLLELFRFNNREHHGKLNLCMRIRW